MADITTNVGGRPLIWQNPEDMANAINEYFAKTPEQELTIFGLCEVLDLSYQDLWNYGKRDRFFEIVKRAKTRIAKSYELDLRKKGRTSDIFMMKQFGPSDMQRIEHTGANGQPLFLPMQVVGRYDLEQPIYEAEIVPESNGLQKPKTNVLDRLIARVSENVPDEG